MLMHVSLLFFPPFRAVGPLPSEFSGEWMLLDSNDSIACQNSILHCNLQKKQSNTETVRGILLLLILLALLLDCQQNSDGRFISITPLFAQRMFSARCISRDRLYQIPNDK